MDFLVKLILEIFVGLPIEAAMESAKLSKMIKTVLFVLIGGVMTVFFGFCTWEVWEQQDDAGTFCMTLITVGMLLLTVCGAIRGYKRNWKQ